jgi:hypothetical protein
MYVEPILSGEKVSTVRRETCRLQAGEIVRATVGPRPAFATLRITRREDITLHDLDAEYRRDVQRLYPSDRRFVRLTFTIEATLVRITP